MTRFADLSAISLKQFRCFIFLPFWKGLTLYE
jgi:hypothetical protein